MGDRWYPKKSQQIKGHNPKLQRRYKLAYLRLEKKDGTPLKIDKCRILSTETSDFEYMKITYLLEDGSRRSEIVKIIPEIMNLE